MITSEKELREYVQSLSGLDAIVVEGYDGVGKGRVLNTLADLLDVVPYRPDYNFWQMHDHRKKDRWKVSGFFLDVFSHFGRHNYSCMPMLFDRGVISGAVYNNDMRIADDYKKLLRDMYVLHILVTCSQEDYRRFCLVRASGSDIDLDGEWDKYLEYTSLYKEALNRSGVSWVEYVNHFDEEIQEYLSSVCEGCGHYSYGVCTHPEKNGERVYKNSERCELSRDIEVQDRLEGDIDVAEMHCL